MKIDSGFLLHFTANSRKSLSHLRLFFANYHPNHLLREEMQAIDLGLKDIEYVIKSEEESENWYKLYSNLALEHVNQRNMYKLKLLENKKLKIELKELWERYNSFNEYFNEKCLGKRAEESEKL